MTNDVPEMLYVWRLMFLAEQVKMLHTRTAKRNCTVFHKAFMPNRYYGRRELFEIFSLAELLKRFISSYEISLQCVRQKKT